jgi:membrane fusion protein (multidrug efflux system)
MTNRVDFSKLVGRARSGARLLCTLLLSGMVGALASSLPSSAQTPVAKAPPAPAVSVVSAVRKEKTPTLTFVGRVEAIDKVDLRARVDGYLEKRLFTEGGEVKQGQLLFVIEKAPYEAQVEQIAASIEAAEAQLRLAKIEFDRKAELVRKQVAAVAQLDDARAKHDEAQATLTGQKAALTQAKINLGYTEVYAPVSGQIGRAQFSVGNFVGPSSGTLATLVSRDPMYASFPVTQRELLTTRKKAAETGADVTAVKVRLLLADGTKYKETGSINFLDVTVSAETDTVTARATFPNHDRMLIDGQLVTVVLELATGETAIFVPQQAVQFDQAGYFVLIADPENRVKVRRVTLGQGREAEVEVPEGLQEGDRVITEGIQKVRPDQVVQVAEGKSSAQPQ